MTQTPDLPPLSRAEAQRRVEADGWRYLLGTLCLSVPVGSMADGIQVATAATAAAGDDADHHLRIDVRPARVELSLQTRSAGAVTGADTGLASRITAALDDSVPRQPPSDGRSRSVEMLEIAIDTLDVDAIRPFWKAVLGYVDEAGPFGTSEGLVDPAGQLPTLWFQQMDAPRPERNRIHLDVTVSHEQAEPRVAAALEAGGRLLDSSHARAFWVLADAEGNEVCVCTWLDRDERMGPPA